MKIRFNRIVQGKELEPFVYNEAPVYCDCSDDEHYASSVKYKTKDLEQNEFAKIIRAFQKAGFRLEQTSSNTLYVPKPDKFSLELNVEYSGVPGKWEKRGTIEKKGWFRTKKLPVKFRIPSYLEIHGEISYIDYVSFEKIKTKPVTDILGSQSYLFKIITPDEEILEELRRANENIESMEMRMHSQNSEAEVWY